MKKLSKMISTTLLAVVIGNPILAHSKMSETMPMHEEVVMAAPETITFNFENPIRLVTMTLTVNDGESTKLDITDFKSFEEVVELPMDDMGAGKYVVEWRGLGKDGHTAKGIMMFVVDPDAAKAMAMPSNEALTNEEATY